MHHAVTLPVPYGPCVRPGNVSPTGFCCHLTSMHLCCCCLWPGGIGPHLGYVPPAHGHHTESQQGQVRGGPAHDLVQVVYGQTHWLLLVNEQPCLRQRNLSPAVARINLTCTRLSNTRHSAESNVLAFRLPDLLAGAAQWPACLCPAHCLSACVVWLGLQSCMQPAGV